MSQIAIGTYSVMPTITRIADDASWTVNGVYGPQDDADKVLFLQAAQAFHQ
jgi:hypothetical protein